MPVFVSTAPKSPLETFFSLEGAQNHAARGTVVLSSSAFFSAFAYGASLMKRA